MNKCFEFAHCRYQEHLSSLNIILLQIIRNKMKKDLLVFLLFAAGAAFGSGLPEEHGEVTFLQLHSKPNDDSASGQRYLVKLNSTISENECGVDQWTGTLDTEVGKAMYSTILAAYLAGKSIALHGTSATTCLSSSMLIRNVFIVY